MKIKKEDIPIMMEGPGTVMRRLEGFGDMDVVYHELPQGMDFSPTKAHGEVLAIWAG